MEPRLFVATKAFIVHDGKVLILRESSKYADGANAGRFDVVGGRVKPGQRFDESLLREIQEETGLSVTIGRPFFVNEWRPTVNGEQWQIVGTFFECHVVPADAGSPPGPSGQGASPRAVFPEVQLSGDHDYFEWIDPKDYRNHILIDNLIPAFEAFVKRE